MPARIAHRIVDGDRVRTQWARCDRNDYDATAVVVKGDRKDLDRQVREDVAGEDLVDAALLGVGEFDERERVGGAMVVLIDTEDEQAAAVVGKGG